MTHRRPFWPLWLRTWRHVQALCVAYMRVGKEFDEGTRDFCSSEEMFLAVVDEYKKILPHYLKMK